MALKFDNFRATSIFEERDIRDKFSRLERERENMKKSWWDSFDSWELAEREWDERAKEASLLFPLDIPSHNPSIPHISPETSRLLRLKGLLWVLRHDKERKLLAFLFQKPFVYFFRYVKSLFRGPSLFKEGDLFFLWDEKSA